MTADDYLRRVGYALGDLPWKMRRDLISELRTHLSELPPTLRFDLGWGRRKSTRPTCEQPRASSIGAG